MKLLLGAFLLCIGFVLTAAESESLIGIALLGIAIVSCLIGGYSLIRTAFNEIDK